MAGKAPESAADLASQPTLSRFENMVTTKDLRRFSNWLLDLYLKTHPGPRKVIVLDMDATNDPTHGRQQLSFFHGYYEEHRYHPLLDFLPGVNVAWREFLQNFLDNMSIDSIL